MTRLNKHKNRISFSKENEPVKFIYDNREYTLVRTFGEWFNYERDETIRLHYDVYVKLKFISLEPLIVDVHRANKTACYYYLR